MVNTIVLAALQLCQVELLKSFGVVATCYVGHSAGETVMGYADGLLTLEQALSVAYYRATFSLEASKRYKTACVMTAVSGMDALEVEKRINSYDVQVVCRNHASNVTLAGPVSAVNDAIKTLKSVSTSVRIVPLQTGGVVYHREDLFPVDILKRLRHTLHQVVSVSKPSSGKWISSSQPEVLVPVVGAEYYSHNIRSCVEFERACARIPKGAVVIEVGTTPIWGNVVTKKLHGLTHFSLAQKSLCQIYAELTASDLWDAETKSRVYVEDLFCFQHNDPVMVHRRSQFIKLPSTMPSHNPFDHVFGLELNG